jgi:hypothetical protein
MRSFSAWYFYGGSVSVPMNDATFKKSVRTLEDEFVKIAGNLA